MPGPTNPEKADWYVYQFEVNHVPFYVGIGRSARCSDRVRWVCSQIKRQLDRKPIKKLSLSAKVIKALILTPKQVQWRYLQKERTREQALELEKRRILNLKAKGYVLANEQHNHRPLPTVREILSFIRKNAK